MRLQAKLGVIGFGIMGRDIVKELQRNTKAKVMAVCDVDLTTLAEVTNTLGEEVRTFVNYPELLRQEDLDGVVVAAPQYAHAEVTIASLEAGHVTFCEKPMAMNVAECEQMIAAAKRAGKGLMIGQVLRYIGPYRYVLELVRSGELGKAVAMRSIRTMGRWQEPWIRPWRLRHDRCGGSLLEINVHEIDLMLCIFGEPVSVSAVGGRLANKQVDYEDFVTGTVVFAEGGLGSVTSANCDYLGKNSGEVYLENGSIYYESTASEVRVARAGQETEVLRYEDIHPEWENGVYREMREFVEACLGERPITIPGEDGMRAVEVAEAMYLSVREKRPVQLPLRRH